jgi:hypothetical protein
MTTVFKCSRCGYENETLHLFKKHFQRKTECKPKVSNIALSEVKAQFSHLLEKHDKHDKKEKTDKEDKLDRIDKEIKSKEEKLDRIDKEIKEKQEDKRSVSPKTHTHTSIQSPTSPITPKRKKRKTRNFGDENREYIKKDDLKDYVKDPLKGIQEIIKTIYFDQEHPENHIIRLVPDDSDAIEIHSDDIWIKKQKKYIYNKMIYMAYGVMEYNILKRFWTEEFRNFIISMGEMDNDDLLDLIQEETEETVSNAEKELNKIPIE